MTPRRRLLAAVIASLLLAAGYVVLWWWSWPQRSDRDYRAWLRKRKRRRG